MFNHLVESCPDWPGWAGDETGATTSGLQGVLHHPGEGEELSEPGQTLHLGQPGPLLLQLLAGVQQGLLDAPQSQLLPEKISVYWLRSNEAGLSLVQSFRVLLAPAVLCHKEPARCIQRAIRGYFACSPLVLYGIRIIGFHARKGPIIGALMP